MIVAEVNRVELLIMEVLSKSKGIRIESFIASKEVWS